MHRFVLLSFLLAACADPADRTASSGTSVPANADTLRAELLARLEADQAVREALIQKQRQGEALDSMDVERLVAVDTANTAWLERVVAEHGWPGRSVVGEEAANAAFLLVQHADRDTAFQARMLPLLERAHAEGEADGQQVALLTDRLAVARGESQIYGTQADLVDGRVVLEPIADSASVDLRREQMGLPPLDEYVRILDSVYAVRRP